MRGRREEPEKDPGGCSAAAAYATKCESTKCLAHANDQRNTVQHESMEANAMEITEDWLEKLQQIPFISCKWLTYV